MTSVWIKVCGLTTEAAVAAAREAGVDAVGCVFHAGSPRNLSPGRAAALLADLPRGIARVAVTRDPSQALIDQILGDFRPDVLQSDAADLARLSLPTTLAVLPVLRSGQAPPAALPRRCLYESAESGAGSLADWSLACEYALASELVLAGGLTPLNVAAAISLVQPFGVDVSSGVESSPGVKDVAMIHSFVAAARAAAARSMEIRELPR